MKIKLDEHKMLTPNFKFLFFFGFTQQHYEQMANAS